MRVALKVAATVAVLSAAAFPGGSAVAQAVYMVTSTGDGADSNPGDGVCDDGTGDCTLRAAIEEANALLGTDTIAFDIAGVGVHTIQPSSILPTVSDPVVIDGYTQPGASPNTNPPGLGTSAVLKIELDGGLGTGIHGLTISAGNSTVRGLVINRFSSSSIWLKTNGGNLIEGNFIGTDTTGTVKVFPFNSATGVWITGSPNTMIGGTTAGARNLISGQFRGIDIGGNDVVIQGNCIGTDATGTVALTLGNTNGIRLDGASNVTIGGTTAEARNIISGNGSGIVILGGSTTGVSVEGNLIGTDITGTAALGNSADGILAGSGISVGGTAPGARNVISGNGFSGISIGDDNLVQGNLIGIDITGTIDLGNGHNGIEMGSNNTIGGTQPGAGNVISGNDGSGVSMLSDSGNLVQGNLIGTDVTGTLDLGNSGNGVRILLGSNNTVGGTDGSARNLISGNSSDGVQILGGGGGGNVIAGNFIGTDITGTTALGNGRDGVRIDGSFGNSVGGLTAGAGNLISGNSGSGVGIFSSGAVGNLVQGNLIGTDVTGTIDRGNLGNGVYAFDGSHNTIGGTTADAKNTLAYNKDAGVAVNLGTGYDIETNSIFSNSGLGIDLGDDGTTANDPGDADSGPNNFQNFPHIASVEINGNGDLVIEYSVDSDTLNSAYPLTIQFFESDPGGQGRTLLGNDSYGTSDYSGGAKTINLGDAIGLGIVNDESVVATATDDSGNTSEFSATAGVSIVPRTVIDPGTMFFFQIYTIDTVFAFAYVGNFADGYTVNDIDPASLLVNGTLSPSSSTVLASHPDLIGNAMEISFPIRDFLLGYGLLWDTTVQQYTVSGQFTDNSDFLVTGEVTIIGHTSGDVNLDGLVDFHDVSYLVTYLFLGGPLPASVEAADVTHDGTVNVADISMLVTVLFGGG